MDVAIGDMVKFEKANEIIPEVVEVMSRVGVRHTHQPAKCPACDHPVVVKGAYLQCVNLECSAQVVSHMRFVLETLGVKGLDVTTIEKLIECGEVEDIEDLFKLNKDLLVAKGFGEVESKKWVSALNEIKTTPAKLLACLGIEGWGETMFEKLFSQSKVLGSTWVKRFSTSTGYSDSESLAHIDAMGPGRSICLLNALLVRIPLLQKLLEHVKLIEEVIVNGSLSGKSFCITGTLSKGRKEIQEDIKKAGGIVKDSVSKGLDYLVTGEDCGSKIEKAAKLGIKTILEEDLYKMIGG
jgi:DNA ligase (NAD+)